MRGQERRLTSSKITELMEYWSDRTFTMMGTMVIITIPTIPIATVRASLMCLVVMHLRQTHERPRRCPRRIILMTIITTTSHPRTTTQTHTPSTLVLRTTTHTHTTSRPRTTTQTHTPSQTALLMGALEPT